MILRVCQTEGILGQNLEENQYLRDGQRWRSLKKKLGPGQRGGGKAQRVHSQELASQSVLLEEGCSQQGQMLGGAWVTEGLGSVR